MGTLLYYARDVDCNMLTSFNTILYQWANPTHITEAEITHLLDYTAITLNAIVQYKASDMILYIDSDASYLCEPWAHIRTGGEQHLRYLPSDPKKDSNIPPPSNGPIHTDCKY